MPTTFARKPPPATPTLPIAMPFERARESLAAILPPSKITVTLDGAVVNLAVGMARCLANTIAHQNRDLCPRAAGYIRDGHSAMSMSVVVGDTIRIVPLRLLDTEAGRMTLRNIHDRLLAEFWDELEGGGVAVIDELEEA
jgi:hypothetical protein